MKKLIPILILFSVVYAIIGCRNNTPPENQDEEKLRGTISISGAFALYPITVKWAEEFQKVYPDIRIDISAGGAGKGLTDALSGMVDLGMFSREVTPEEEQKGTWKIALVKDAVLPTINSHNPALTEILEKGLSNSNLREIFISRNAGFWNYFPQYENTIGAITAYTRSDACGAADMWGKYLESAQDGLKGIGVYGDPGMADAVRKDVSAVGYNNVIYVYDISSRKKYDGIEVIPLDLNENGIIDSVENFYGNLDEVMQAIRDERYPAPPARPLYFVAKGKPESNIVRIFLKWILTEGQKFTDECGYVQLNADAIAEELNKLN